MDSAYLVCFNPASRCDKGITMTHYTANFQGRLCAKWMPPALCGDGLRLWEQALKGVGELEQLATWTDDLPVQIEGGRSLTEVDGEQDRKALLQWQPPKT